MKLKTNLIFVLSTLVAVASAQPMRVLVSHEEPTKEQLSLISIDKGKLDQAAKDLDFEVVRDGEDTLVFDADLYNCRVFDRCLKGLDALSRLVVMGKTEFTLGELTGEEKANLRNLLLFQGYGDESGPALFDDKTSISLGMHWSVNLESGGKKAESYVDKLPSPPREGSQANYSKKEFEDFKEKELPKYKVKKHDINQLVVHTAVGWVSSVRRTEAIGKLMDLFAKRMKLQAKAFDDKQMQLVNAYGGSDSIHKDLAVNSVSDSEKVVMEGGLLTMGGFKDRESARNFMSGAKFTGATPSLRIGVYFNVDNQRRSFSTVATIHRGG